jgi:hypothetical protein
VPKIRRRTTRPRDKIEMRDLEGDGRTNSCDEKNRRVDVRGQEPLGIVEAKSRHRRCVNTWEADGDTFGDGRHRSTSCGPRAIVACSTRMHSRMRSCPRVMLRASIPVLRDGFPSGMSLTLVFNLRGLIGLAQVPTEKSPTGRGSTTCGVVGCGECCCGTSESRWRPPREPQTALAGLILFLVLLTSRAPTKIRSDPVSRVAANGYLRSSVSVVPNQTVASESRTFCSVI